VSAPESGRSGFWEQFALWAVLGASLYAMPFGALLVPALSIEQAILAAATAAAIAGGIIAIVASLAARTGRCTTEILSEPFGSTARLPMATIVLLRHVLIAAFVIIVMTDAAELVSSRALGEGLRPVWVLLFVASGIALARAGGHRAMWFVRRAWVWLALLLAIGVAASAYAEFEIPSYLRRPAAGGWPSFWQAVDVMLVFPLLWLPVVADFARFSGSPRAATRGAFAGVFLMCTWFGALGILYLPATESGDIPGFAAGMGLGLGAIAVIALLQLDETYVSIRGAVSALEVARVQRKDDIAAVLALAVAVPLALFTHIGDLEAYALLTVSVFVPLFGVAIARSFWPAERNVAASISASVIGFVLYQWITPADIGWWRDAWSAVFDFVALPFPLSDEVSWLGAVLPSFFIAGLAYQLFVLPARLGILPEEAPEVAA
jgi:purine-cytosine permease-like protein